jgi:hypothetical protein
MVYNPLVNCIIAKAYMKVFYTLYICIWRIYSLLFSINPLSTYSMSFLRY